MMKKRHLEERFWEKVDVRGSDDCWEWLASKNRKGYGQFWFSGKMVRSHRLSWKLSNRRDVPVGLMVIHSCDNPTCVNPQHLSIGTAKNNSDDMIKKGRRADTSGKNHGNWGKRGSETSFYGKIHSKEAVEKIRTSQQGELGNGSKITEEDVLRIRHMYSTGRCSQREIAETVGIGQQMVSLIVRRKRWKHI